MSSRVQRFIVRAHPTDNHPKYYRWQTATLCVFVGDDDSQRAFQAAKKAVADNHWIAVDTRAGKAQERRRRGQRTIIGDS
jgi:hypothetical protein